MTRALENFKRLIKEKNLSQFKVAKDLGYSPSYFYNWTNGRSFPSLLTLCNIAEYLDITLIELLGYEQEHISKMEKELICRFDSLDTRKQVDAIAFLVSLQNIQQQQDYEFRKKQNEDT